MSLPTTVKRLRSGVVHLTFVSNGQRIASGSGFLIDKYLVTNNHVFAGPTQSEVYLHHHADPQLAPQQIAVMPYAAFARLLVSGSSENSFDFAILDASTLNTSGLARFELGDPRQLNVGEAIAFLGFPLEHENLVCHSGIVSSFFTSGTASIIQLDASINQSNSGGPLIDPASGLVLGYITRKGTGLSNLFGQLLNVFDKNIEVLSRPTGMGIEIGGVDPVQLGLIGQRAMKQLANEILRSANVGIGYAFSVEHLKSDNVFSQFGL